MASLRLREICSGSIRGTARDPLRDPFAQNRRELLNRDAFLFHGIALTQRDRIAQRSIFLPQRFKIDGHTEWRANLVLAPVATPDRAALVIKGVHVRSQKIDNR